MLSSLFQRYQGRGQRQTRKSRRAFARPGLEQLEDRVVPATASLVDSTLFINFAANGATAEAVSLVNNGTNITLSGSVSGTTSFSTAAIDQISISDSGGSTAQSVTFTAGTALALSGGLSSSGVETVTLANAVNTSGGAVSLTADTIQVSGAIDTGGGAFSANADSNQDGVGTFTISAAVMAGWTQQARLTASDGAAGDQSFAVAISGDTAVVGAYLDDVGSNSDQGSAYVFTRSGTTWTQQAKLTASDGLAGDGFGYGVAVSGNTIVVSALFDDIAVTDQGSAYVFTRSGTTWTQQAKLTASDAAASDRFGGDVAISGDTALIGAYLDDVSSSNQGSAYVFTRSGTSWTQQAKLTASDAAATDLFGTTVAISGDTAVVGASFDNVGANADQGSAYVFTRSGATWTQQAKLTASDGAASDQFGFSAAISGDMIVVGAYLDNVGANADQGSAYVFTRTGTTWTQQAKLTASDGAASDQFGFSEVISGDTIVVGAYLDDVGANADQGSAYVFTRTGTTWTQQAKLTAGDGAASDQFGYAAAISNDTIVMTALLDDVGANADQGSAYAFTLASASSGGSISTGDGTVSITAADAIVEGAINAGAGLMRIIQSTAGRAIDIGNNTVGQMGLTDSELDRITAATVQIGDAASGGITISAVISPASYKTLRLQDDTNFSATGGFASDVTSASVYEKIEVAGAVSINTSATLTVTTIGGFVPAAGDVFTLINNTSASATTGNFAGKLEGAAMTVGGVNKIITYVGGTGNDVVVVPGNQPPSIAANAAAVAADEGGAASNTGTFSDQQGNSTVTITASIGTVAQNNTNGTWTWSLNAGDGPAEPIGVTIIATDNQGAAANVTFTYAINNVPPTISLNGAATVNEGSPYELNLGVVTDPGTDTISSYVINWGDGTIENFTGNPANTTRTHTYSEGPANRTNNITVTDEDGTVLAGTLSVRVDNVSPTLAALSVTPETNENDFATLTGTFTDPGLLDPHTIVVEWDDPNAQADSTFAFFATSTLSVGDTFNSTTDGAALTITAMNTTTGAVSFSVVHQYVDDGLSPGNGTSQDGSTIHVNVTDDDAAVFTSIWEASSGLLPDQDCPEWALIDTADPEEPGLAGGMLTISSSADAEIMGYSQTPPDIVIPGTLVIEARVRFVSGLSSPAWRAPVVINFTTAPNVGNALFIDVDEMWVGEGNNVKGTGAALASVDTSDAFHTYRIEVSGTATGSQVRAYQDGVLKVMGSTFTSAPHNGSVEGVSWGETSLFAHGVSEWQFVRHNAGISDCHDNSVTTAINNVAPTFEAGSDETILPPALGAFSRNNIVISDLGAFDTLTGTVDFGDDTGPQDLVIDQDTRSFDLSHTFPNTSGAPAIQTYTVAITVRDDDLGTLTDTFEVTVNLNTPPVSLDDTPDIDEDHAVTFDVLANDSDEQNNIDRDQTVNVTAPAAGVLTNNGDGTFTFDPNGNFEYLAAGDSATVSFDYQVFDLFGDNDTGAVTITINGVNDDPIVTVDTDSVTVNEGQRSSNSGTFADIDVKDVVRVMASVGTTTTNADGTWSWSFDTSDGPDQTQTITITATDNDGASSSVTFDLVVDNVAPVLANLTNSSPDCGDAFMGVEPVTIHATFTDAGKLDTHTVQINWGDGATTAGAVTEANGSGAVSGSHVYATGGTFTITVTLADNDGGTSQLTTQATVGGIGLQNGVLRIIGTDERDVIYVHRNGNHLVVRSTFGLAVLAGDDEDCDDERDDDYDDDRYHRNFTRTVFNLADVASIDISACGGNDRVYVGHRVLRPATIDGGAGNDSIHGGGDNDTIIDLLGNNRIYARKGNDTVTLGDGHNRVWTDGGIDFITAGNGNNEIHAGRGDDTIVVGNGNNTIRSDGGVDRITAGDGNNDIRAGAGNDLISVGNGNNYISSGAGDDTITVTGGGCNTIDAGAGNDVVFGGAGNDTINGGAGDDILVGGAGNDIINGGAGRDLMIGGLGADRLSGHAEDDILIAGFTLYDGNRTALDALMREWTSNNTYSTRTTNIMAGTGLAGGYRLNGNDGATQTVFNDNDVDTLTGSQAQDWFFANLFADNGGVLDVLTDKAANEYGNDTDF